MSELRNRKLGCLMNSNNMLSIFYIIYAYQRCVRSALNNYVTRIQSVDGTLMERNRVSGEYVTG